MMTSAPPAPSPLIPPHDYAALLRSDLVAFIHRAFCNLNSQTLFMPTPRSNSWLPASKIVVQARSGA
jgi:hypothetical protein